VACTAAAAASAATTRTNVWHQVQQQPGATCKNDDVT
jgi:hypothetical protein